MGLSRATQADLVEHCKAAVFSVRPKSDITARGTAAAIRSNLLITCHHVVTGTEEVILVSHNPVFEGKKKVGKGEVVAIEENLDLALLRSRVHLPTSLQLEDGKTLDDSTPLLVWSWPGWNAFEQGEVDPCTALDLHPAPHAAVMSESWTENRIPRFSFAGRIEGGMSGGAVVSALTGKIVGIVTSSWNIDPDEIVDTWWQLYGCEAGHDPAKIKALRALLALGMGIALNSKEAGVFLDSKVPEVL